MNFLNTVTDIARGIGNILLPGQPFAKIQPISNVSSKPVEIGKVDTATRTIYENTPAIKAVTGNPVVTYVMGKPVTLSDTKAQTGTMITTNPLSSGIQGNIWDILKKGAETVISTGFNVLTEKVNDWVSGNKVETSYVPNATVTKQTNPFSILEPSKLMQILNPTVQPAVSEGVKQGIISVAGKPPTWIWFVLAGLGVVILIPKLRR